MSLFIEAIIDAIAVTGFNQGIIVHVAETRVKVKESLCATVFEVLRRWRDSNTAVFDLWSCLRVFWGLNAYLSLRLVKSLSQIMKIRCSQGLWGASWLELCALYPLSLLDCLVWSWTRFCICQRLCWSFSLGLKNQSCLWLLRDWLEGLAQSLG